MRIASISSEIFAEKHFPDIIHMKRRYYAV